MENTSAMTWTPPILPYKPAERGSRNWTLLKTQEADGKMRRGREVGDRWLAKGGGGAHKRGQLRSTVQVPQSCRCLWIEEARLWLWLLSGQINEACFLFPFLNDRDVQWEGVGLWMWPMAETHDNSKQSNVGLKHTSAGTSGSGGGASWLEIRGWC